jgi:hypothetical protein
MAILFMMFYPVPELQDWLTQRRHVVGAQKKAWGDHVRHAQANRSHLGRLPRPSRRRARSD